MNILRSRTFWTLVVVFLFNGFQSIAGNFPPAVSDVVNALGLVLATYFHINPSQNYNQSEVPATPVPPVPPQA